MPPIFASPVRGRIYPVNWKRPAGSTAWKVTQIFGCTGFPAEPPYGSCAHYHRGIDISDVGCGADVLSVAAGKVTLAGADALSGGALRVVVEHAGGWFSLYYHLHDISVKVGQAVATGTIVGHVGKTGWADGCHLHFEVHASSERLSFFDPWPHLAQNVTVRPAGPDINIRATAGSGSTPGALYAQTKTDGLIHRTDGVELGPIAAMHAWGGRVAGASYTVAGVAGTSWEKIWLDGRWLYIASPLAIRSV